MKVICCESLKYTLYLKNWTPSVTFSELLQTTLDRYLEFLACALVIQYSLFNKGLL